MFHKPKFSKKMKQPQFIEHQDEKNAVTQETAERLAHEAYEKAFTDAKGLFDTRLLIDQKIAAGIGDVDKRWKWYIGVCSSVVAIISFFGVPQFIRREAEKQISQFTDEKVASMIDASVKVTEQRVKAELETIKNETTELQTTILSAREEMDALSAGLFESKSMLDVYEQIAAARTGNRTAYDALRQIAKGSNRVAHIACLGVDGIDAAYEERRRIWGRSRMGLQNLQTGETAITIPPEEAMYYVYTDQPGVCEGALNGLIDRKQVKYVATLVRAVLESKDLSCVYAGICGLEQLLGKQFPALGIDEVRLWWEEHNGDERYHYGFEKCCEISKQANESEESFKWRQAMSWKGWIEEEPEQYWVAQRLIIFLLNTKEDGTHKRKEILEYALEYWANEQPRQENWYLAKTVYLCLYGSNQEIVDFINTHLAEHPSFEKELRQYENEFPKHFFQPGPIHWPSQSAVQLENGGADIEKVLE